MQKNYYAGTPVAITEYNWGAEDHINGATTQADIYGIFGREGLDMATRWTTPKNDTPTFKAMQMYRNYDGKVRPSATPASQRTRPIPTTSPPLRRCAASDGAMTVMVINKALSGDTPR